MSDPFAGYDAWKTASPYDDEIDPVDEIDRFIERINNEFITRAEVKEFLGSLKDYIEGEL